MITVIVRYKLPATIGKNECLAHFHKIAPGFAKEKGFIRKQFIGVRTALLARGGRPPSQSWKTFLRNHAEAIAAVDMCMVPTLSFERVFAFLVLGHGRRQLLWFEVTRHPTAIWLARQITEAFPWASAPGYLVWARLHHSRHGDGHPRPADLSWITMAKWYR